jgi:hypothetical protein
VHTQNSTCHKDALMQAGEPASVADHGIVGCVLRNEHPGYLVIIQLACETRDVAGVRNVIVYEEDLVPTM